MEEEHLYFLGASQHDLNGGHVIHRLCQAPVCRLNLGEGWPAVQVEEAEDNLPRREVAVSLLAQRRRAGVVRVIDSIHKNLDELRVDLFKAVAWVLFMVIFTFLCCYLALCLCAH